jgi:aspartate/methionine/tyrosine aminotransferase
LPANVLVTPGAKPLLFFGVLATCNPGDEVIYPNPGFPIYESVISWSGATPVPLHLTEEHGFAFTAEDIAERLSDRTRLVILNSPANPTGGVMPTGLLNSLAEVLADHNCWILSDEVYSEMVYEGRHESIASRPGMLERTILLDGFSKTFAMTGWRLGYAAVPDPLVEPLTRLFINCHSCTSPAYQLAGVAALTGPWDAVETMMSEFRARRRLIVDLLNVIPGVSCIEPSGAFYAFPNVSGTGLAARELQDRLLEEVGVAMLAGTAFGGFGEGYMRVSYANSQENIREALRLMAELVANG